MRRRRPGARVGSCQAAKGRARGAGTRKVWGGGGVDEGAEGEGPRWGSTETEWRARVLHAPVLQKLLSGRLEGYSPLKCEQVGGDLDGAVGW